MDEGRGFRLAISLFIGIMIGIFIFLVFIFPRGAFHRRRISPAQKTLSGSRPGTGVSRQFLSGPQRGGYWGGEPISAPVVKTLATEHDVFSSPLVWGDRVYAGSLDCHLYAIAPGPPLEIIWKYRAGHKIFSSPGADGDGNVYFGAVDGRIISLDRDGQERWDFLTRGPVTSSPAIHGDHLYVNSSDGSLYALNLRGSLRWKADIGNSLGEVSPSPAVDTFDRVVTGSTDGKVYCFSQWGNPEWTLDLESPVYSTPAILADGGIVTASGDGKLVLISPGGSLIWSVLLGSPVESSPVVDPNRGIYLGLSRGGLVALDFSGRQRWEYSGAGPVNSSPAIDHEGNIYLGDESGTIHSLNPLGQLRWTYPTEGAIFSSPALGPNFMVVGSEDNHIYFLFNNK